MVVVVVNRKFQHKLFVQGQFGLWPGPGASVTGAGAGTSGLEIPASQPKKIEFVNKDFIDPGQCEDFWEGVIRLSPQL